MTDIISIYGAILSTLIAVVSGIKYLYDRRSRLEINIHIPESSQYVIPLEEGIFQEGLSIEEIVAKLGKIEPNEPPQKLRDVIRVFAEAFINDPREAKIRIYVRNIGKRMANIVSLKIIMKSDAMGEHVLRTIERNKAIPAGDQYIEEVKIGDVLDMLKPKSPDEDENIKLLFSFKDEKHRIYSAQQPFDYIEWQERVESFKNTRKKVHDLGEKISKLLEYFDKIGKKSSTDGISELNMPKN